MRRSGGLRPLIPLLAIAALAAGCASPPREVTSPTLVDGVAVSPYIDQLREEIRERDAEEPRDFGEGYTARRRRELEPEDAELRAERAEDLVELPEDEGSYIKGLQRRDPTLLPTAEAPPSFTEDLRGKLEPRELGGAIQAVHEGRSDLKMRKSGGITAAGGIRVGASMTRTYAAGSRQLRPFSDVYPASFVPDVTFFGEIQPWHSEWFGNIGLFASAGIAVHRGAGKFAFTIPKPTNVSPGQFFSDESQTRMSFTTVPLTVGLNYRFNLLRVLRPFVLVGPSLIPYFETRSDDRPSTIGYSRALTTSLGCSLLLDWLSDDTNFHLWDGFGVHHSYLTVEYLRQTSLASEVAFDTSGLTAGLTFEF